METCSSSIHSARPRQRVCHFPYHTWAAWTTPCGMILALGWGGSLCAETAAKLERASASFEWRSGSGGLRPYMVGKRPERQRARDYITWLIQQRTKPVFVDITDRTDATAVEVSATQTIALAPRPVLLIEMQAAPSALHADSVMLARAGDAAQGLLAMLQM
eukprot:2791629-Amphidinium_carterae.1